MDYMSRKEAAAALKVSEQTVDSLIRKGRLQASQLVPNGTVRISVSSLERLLEGR